MIEFRDGRIDSGDGGRLAQAMKDEISSMYAGLELDSPDMPKAGPDEMNPPNGVFLVGYDGDEAVCCGGIKRLDEEACEIKRMFVTPHARGRGLARELLAALEARALAEGYKIARLDTGPKQAAALHLYPSVGYVEIPNFNANPVATYFAEKRLAEP